MTAGETIRLKPWHRWSIYGVTIGLCLTGALWLIAHYTLRTPGQFGETINPLEPWMMRLHGLFVTVALFMYGSLLRTHMIKAWHVRRNRYSGAIAAAILVLLAASGYLLYYASDEYLRPLLSVAHWGTGAILAAALPLHVYYGRRKSRQRSHPKTAVRHERAVHHLIV